MKRFLLVSISAICLLACEKEKKISTNVEGQEWYKNLMIPCNENTICKTSIIKALYKKDTVYYTALVGALCDPVFTATLLNSNGEVVKVYSGFSSKATFNEEVTYIETAYRCDGK
jgi:hypothetical protein